MSSYLDFEGVYDKKARYMVNNWSQEDYTQHFGAESVYNDTNVIETQPAYEITLKAGEMREFGQFEAYIITRGLVDREMFREAKKHKSRKEQESAEMGIGNRDVRKPYEDKTISKIEAGKESPFMDELRRQIREEELSKLANIDTTREQKKVNPVKVEKIDKTKNIGEFEDA